MITKMGEHYLSNSFKPVFIHQGVIELLSLLEFPRPRWEARRITKDKKEARRITKEKLF